MRMQVQHSQGEKGAERVPRSQSEGSFVYNHFKTDMTL